MRLEAVVNLQEGAVNSNEVLHAVGTGEHELSIKVAQGVIDAYQRRVVELACTGQGDANRLPHEAKGCEGQMCLGGVSHGGGKRERRNLRTEIGALKVETWQVVCGVCGTRFRVLGPLLKVASRARPTIGLKPMMAETVTDMSYRKGDGRTAAPAQVDVPHGTAQRRMAAGDRDALQEPAMSSAATWKSFAGVMADGTGYKRQGAESTRGELRLVMGVKNGRLMPLGAWADKSREDIDKEIPAEKPAVRAPVVVVDGETGREVLGNLAEGIRRCRWHLPRRLGFALYEDGIKKPAQVEHLEKLAGLIKIELPEGDYKSVSQEMRDQIQGRVLEARETMKSPVFTFRSKGYRAAASYLRNATENAFTIVEKWLELGYMPPKAISLLERVMREMGRRIKKTGASWKEKGVRAVARGLPTRIYDPKRRKEYRAKLLDLQGRCVMQDVSLSFAVS
ncbi:MAG: hypothetical protein C4293_03965 [Nitrospiraceae bacterium]